LALVLLFTKEERKKVYETVYFLSLLPIVVAILFCKLSATCSGSDSSRESVGDLVLAISRQFVNTLWVRPSDLFAAFKQFMSELNSSLVRTLEL
jgi:hypothetical protein